MQAELEHANITVTDPDETAKWMGDVFGWQVRWAGDAMQTGRTVHVGTKGTYLALFSFGGQDRSTDTSYKTVGAMNHIGVTVTDLDATEAKVKAAGFTTHMHGDYEPGRRFYFNDADGIEYECVAYD
jgi:catechol 2,3-dioxygenase-like lactoylglutathione lyase family enzyme